MSDVRGVVDGLEGAYVVGWAAPGESGANRVVTICDENGRRLASARAARFRADLVSLGLKTADFAFRIPILKPLGMKRLHVMADGSELDGSPLEMGTEHLDCDVHLADGCVTGWIMPRSPEVGPTVVTIQTEDGRIVGTSRATASVTQDPLFAPWKFRAELDQACFGAGELRLACTVAGRIFARVTADLRIEGTLEILNPRRCAGWLMSPDAPRRRFTIEVARAGEPPVEAACDVARNDVLEAYPELRDGQVGFDVTLPEREDVTALTGLSIRLAGSQHHLFESPYAAGQLPALVSAARRAAGLVRQHAGELGAETTAILQVLLRSLVTQQRVSTDGFHVRQHQSLASPGDPAITIVIPVYRDVAVTRDCIDSILQHRDPARHRILVVNDCSPDPGMAGMLAGFAGLPNVVLRTNDANRGFIGSANRALGDKACRGDVVMLNSDTRVFAGWLDELSQVAHSSDLIGTVTALSNNATIFSYPHPDLRRENIDDISMQTLADIALRENLGLAVPVPTGHGFCLFIKHEVIRAVGLFDEGFGRGYGEENDFCARAADLGYQHVAAAGVLVEHKESVSFTGDKADLLRRNLGILEARYPEYSPIIIAFERKDGLRHARWKLDAERLRRAGSATAGYVITVSNWLTGGTVKAIEQIAGAAGLHSFRNLAVKVRIDGIIELTCADPLVRAVFAPGEAAALFSILSSLPVESLLVHQTLGYDETFLDLLTEFARGSNAVFYGHDYYPICPRVTMIDAVGGFCDVASPDVCVRCIGLSGPHEASALDPARTLDHRSRYARLLAGFDRVVTPSQSASSYYARAFPGLEVAGIHHPEDLTAVASVPRAGTMRDVLLLGAIGPHKGSRQLLEIARQARLSHPDFTFHVIGHTDIDDQLGGVGNVRITGRYAPDELAHLVAAANGRLALFLQAWPETYSYTLSEAISLGLIPLVPDIGAPAERVRAAGFGHVFAFPIRPLDVLELLGRLAGGTLDAWKEPSGPARFVELSNTATQVREAILGRSARRERVEA